MIIIEKGKYTTLTMLIIGLILLCFITTKPKNIPSDGDSVGGVRDKIDEAQTNQYNQSASLEEAAGEVKGIRSEVSKLGDGTQSAIDREQEAGRLIEECQSILAEIRKGNQ